MEKIELSAYTQKVSQQCSARYKRYGSCLKESNINASHPQQMLFVAKKETSARAARGGGGAKRLRRRERRACMRVIVDRLRAVHLFLQLVRC